MPITHQYITVSLDSLKEYEKNSRNHEPWQINKVAKSMKEFGWTVPVLVDENGMLLAGHCRKKAGILLGLKECPAIRINGLSEDQKKALAIKDNQLACMSSWLDDILREEIIDLKESKYDIDSLGFDDKFLEDLLNPQAENPEESEQDQTSGDASLRIYGPSLPDLEDLAMELQDQGYNVVIEFPKKKKSRKRC